MKHKRKYKTKARFELGRNFNCTGYYKKVNDGTHIEVERNEKGEIEKAFFVKNNSPEEYETKELHFEGDGDEKRYYEFKEASFSGVYVGEKEIDVTRCLYTDVEYDPFGNEIPFIGKHSVERVRCAIIYFQRNSSRLVPLDCLADCDDSDSKHHEHIDDIGERKMSKRTSLITDLFFTAKFPDNKYASEICREAATELIGLRTKVEMYEKMLGIKKEAECFDENEADE